MEILFKRNYEANKKRGLITSKTTLDDFLIKLDEERKEVNLSYDFEAGYIDSSELVDVMLVCASTIIHIGKNPTEEIEKKVLINEERGRVVNNKLTAARNVLRLFSDGESFEAETIKIAIDTVLNHIKQ